LTPEFREEAVRLHREQGAAIAEIARWLGVGSETLRKWVRQAAVDARERVGAAREEHTEIVSLKRELRQVEAEKPILQRAVYYPRSPIAGEDVSAGGSGGGAPCRLHPLLGARRLPAGLLRLVGGTRPLRPRAARPGAEGADRRGVGGVASRLRGVPRVAKGLRRKRGQPAATKRVAWLMGELGPCGLSRGRKGRGTTVQDPAATSAPDLLKRNFSADAPDRVWVADTYIRCHEGWLYLAIVIDFFSRKIVGWSMRASLEAEIVSDALAMAVARRRRAAGVIHRSDRGSQYTSILIGKTLRELDAVPSMGSRGCAYDNAACESAIGTTKLELVEQHVFATRDIARLRVFDYIEAFHNPLRMHTTLGDLSPNEYEAAYHETLIEDTLAA